MFHFQDGEPENYVPKAGDLVLYSADSRNVHCVDEITDGERLTLTLWFSRESSFDEDAKLLSLLAQSIPLPAPSNMYWYSLNQACDDQQGYDIHFARLFVLGFDIYPTQEKSCFSEKHSLHSSNVFTEPLQLVREGKLYSRKFTNLLHALQAVQFYYWKQQALQQREIFMDNTSDVSLLSDEQKEVVHELRSAFSSAIQLDTRVLCYSSTANSSKLPFDWACFCAAITCWEEYTFELLKQLRMHIPFWKDHQSLFSVSSSLDK